MEGEDKLLAAHLRSIYVHDEDNDNVMQHLLMLVKYPFISHVALNYAVLFCKDVIATP